MTTTSETIPNLAPKTKLSGTVTKTTLAGIVVDVGMELPGVVHISQLRREPVNRVEDFIQVGQTVEAWVRRVRKDRIEMTMIEPLRLEWSDMKPDMPVKGKVVRVESYGAFVDIGAERPGLVHVSELAHGYVKSANEVVKEGDEVEAVILEVDRKKKQIRLSMKALQAEVIEKKPVKEKRKNKKKRGTKARKEENETTPVVEAEPTVMEVAWREALEKAHARKSNDKARRSKSGVSQEQEEILSRTLKSRMPTT
ncbi:MAG: S1 RNA-binding domain-containing protein [Candidatus Villigracilaceae bacterium]